jgi:cell filamentation protein, protein adenylyltransferase
MYDGVDDPYCYPGTNVLKNRRNLRTQGALDRFETVITAQRFTEAMPVGKPTEEHYRRVHRHIFSDVYAWAGEYREKVRISKGDSTFCYPENIHREMAKLFRTLRRRDDDLRGLAAREFAHDAATFSATLNAIHPFRDGNGRSQLAFTALLANAAGHPLHLDRLIPEEFLTAMIQSFRGDEELLVEQLTRLL